MKSILLSFLFLISVNCYSQYIAVRAKYIDTRLVDDSPNPPKRQNHLILNFYEVSPSGVYTLANLVNYDLYIYKEGGQYGNVMGGVLDSTGNNYPGYPWPAPKAVAYYNSYGAEYMDCVAGLSTHYVVNGNTLDAGWIGVSYWDIDYGTMNPIECFTAPNISLPYYNWPHPYFTSPGNVNFDWTALFPTPPYNVYNFHCGGPQQVVMRGVLGGDSSGTGEPLPVRFGNVGGDIENNNVATISWSNLTESDLLNYTIEKSIALGPWQIVGTVLPTKNDGSAAAYSFQTIQAEERAYYRIKATENTGKVFYSSIVAIKKAGNNSIPEEIKSELLIYPNPVSDEQINIRLTNANAGRYIASIVTPDGKQVKHKMIEHDGGDLQRQIELDGLHPGLYQFVIRSINKKYSARFIYGY